jgi:hypothetical protein
MAIKLTDKPDTMAPDSDYPYGDIRDRNGLTPGTPVSREVYADFHQFFERLMDKAGVTHNGLPDNDYSGFQLFESLVRLMNEFDLDLIFRISQSGTGNPTPGAPEKNNFGFVPPFTATRSGAGTYTVTIPGLGAVAPALSASWICIQSGIPNGTPGSYVRWGLDDDDIWIRTYNSSGTLADSILDDYVIFLRLSKNYLSAGLWNQ